MAILYVLKEYVLFIVFWIRSFWTEHPEHWSVGEKGDVVLIPGFNESWYFFYDLANAINKFGYRVHIFEYNTYKRIDETAEILEKYIQDHNLKKATLIGHSKGGLVIRRLAEKSDFTGKCITISTPNMGSWFGYLRFLNLFEMAPKSEFLRNLSSSTKASNFFNYYSSLDNYVLPNKNLILENAENIKIKTKGHTRILKSKELIQNILEHLK